MSADDPHGARRHGRRRGSRPSDDLPHDDAWEQPAQDPNPWLQSPLANAWLQEAGWDFEETEGEDAWSTGEAVRRFSVSTGSSAVSLAPTSVTPTSAPAREASPLTSATTDWEQDSTLPVTEPAQPGAAPAPLPQRTVIPRFRRELHGLRAFALLLVAIYHIWFGRVSGGVDVFLFLSAFFLTGTFVRRLDNKRPLAVPRYWLHTFKRLLPPAAVTITLTLLGTALVLPQSLWPTVMRQAIASITYWQNYLLVQEAVDYQARNAGTASPLQHFWSLAVQGQVFLFWPLLFLLAVPASRRGRSVRRPLAIVFSLVLAASLTWSVISTATQQPVAYFDTLARLWEFALGSLLALAMPFIDRFLGARRPEEEFLPRLRWLRGFLGWVGIAGLLACGLVMDVTSLFPGWIAIWPTAAAGLIIIAGHSGLRWGVDRLLSTRPFALLGDISYALYLVHWPLLVMWLSYSAQERAGVADGLAVLAVSILAAWLLTRLVDAPIRRSVWIEARALRPMIAVAASLALVVGTSLGWRAALPDTTADSEVDATAAPSAPAVPADASTVLTSVPADLRPLGYELDSQWPTQPHDCPGRWAVSGLIASMDCDMLQPADAQVNGTIVIVGSSHARQFAPALASWAQENAWQVVNLHMNACDYAEDPSARSACTTYTEFATQQIRELKADAVLTTVTRSDPASSAEAVIPGQQPLLKALLDDGIDVLAVRDTPRWQSDAFVCAEAVLDDGGSPTDADTACGADVSDKLAAQNPATGLTALSTETARVIPLDMTPLVCPDGRCSPILGPRYVYMDDNHLTEVFTSEVLAPRMSEDLDTASFGETR